MELLSVLNFTAGDFVTLVLIPGCGAIWILFKYFEARTDKRSKDLEAKRIEIEAQFEKEKLIQEKAVEKEQIRVNAEVEKEKVQVQGEVDKAKEKSVGNLAIISIWKAVKQLEDDICELNDKSTEEHADKILIKEIIRRTQEDINLLMSIFFDDKHVAEYDLRRKPK